MYSGEKSLFTIEQVMGMLFTKMKRIAEMNLKKSVQDCVVSVSLQFHLYVIVLWVIFVLCKKLSVITIFLFPISDITSCSQ